MTPASAHRIVLFWVSLVALLQIVRLDHDTDVLAFRCVDDRQPVQLFLWLTQYSLTQNGTDVTDSLPLHVVFCDAVASAGLIARVIDSGMSRGLSRFPCGGWRRRY